MQENKLGNRIKVAGSREKQNDITATQNLPTATFFFQSLHIFDDENVNILCDDLFHFIKKNTGEDAKVCGSVAKIFSGMKNENYHPKDIDIVVSPWAFRLLGDRLRQWSHRFIISVEYQPYRYIFYTEKVIIEIWKEIKNRDYYTIEKYQNKIHYTKYTRLLWEEKR